VGGVIVVTLGVIRGIKLEKDYRELRARRKKFKKKYKKYKKLRARAEIEYAHRHRSSKWRNRMR
jgi:hypothetical protein